MADQESVQAPVVAQQQGGAPLQAPEEDEKFFAALGYFAFLFVIPLLVKPKSQFCRFHAMQSLVLFGVTLLVLMILGLVPSLGSLFTLALFALYVLAIYRSYMGEWWNIPVVSGISGKISAEKLYEKAGLAVAGISGLKEKVADAASRAAEEAKKMGEDAPQGANRASGEEKK